MAKRQKIEKIDGEIHPGEISKLRAAIRLIWQRSSVARKNCLKRATDAKGFGKCERCKKKVARLAVDHTLVMGDVLSPDYIKRMWVHSSQLKALCSSCHGKKTRAERALIKKKLFTDKY